MILVTSDGICVDALGDFDGGCNNNSDCPSGFFLMKIVVFMK